MRSGRRAFLRGLGGVSIVALSGGCHRPDARELALRGTIERVLIPDGRAITQTSDALRVALLQLSASDGAPALARARAAWRSAALAWQRAFAFPHGPYIKTQALLRAAYWAVRSRAVADVVLGNEPIDAPRVARLGVDIKGIFAIEQLLFEGPALRESAGRAPGARGSWLEGPSRARALMLLGACADDVCAHARAGSAALGSGEPFISEFARAGQLSVNRLVSQLLGTVETATLRLQGVLAHQAQQRLQPSDVEGGPSGISSELLATWLAVCVRAYGAGSTPSLARLVESAAPAIHAHVAGAFAAASAALGRLDQPLERAVQADPTQLTAAIDKLKQLEVALRSELASALGVTISFGSRDGD
jgi:predicted lipoprotein